MTTARRNLIGFGRRADSARLVADLVRADILTGRVADPLPQEWDLTRTYGATRNELRDAMALLQKQGLVRRVPGSGTFALAPGRTFHLDRVDENVWVEESQRIPAARRLGYPSGRYRCVNARVDAAPEPVAARLRISPGSDVLYVETVVELDGEPQSLRSSWIALATVPGILDLSLDAFLPDTIERIRGRGVYSARSTFDALNADEETARILGMPVGGAVLFTERLYMLTEDEPAEFGFTRHRGDRSHIVSGWSAP